VKSQILQSNQPVEQIVNLYATSSSVIRTPEFEVAEMTEQFNERTAGVWVPLAFYAVGGAYMLAFWGLFARSAYQLLTLGALSLVIAAALYSLSRWAFWLGLLSFPLLFVEFLYALMLSVNFVGWYPDNQTTAFHASIIMYLVFLTLSLILLIDKRNTLKGDRVLDLLNRPAAAPGSSKKPD
jgi:hypothetical protein